MAPLPVSYVLTYRGRDPARAGNLAVVLAWLATLDLAEIIVVEQDVAPTLAPRAGVTLMHVFNPGPFNKGWGLNVGARRSGQPLLAFGDADTFCHSFARAAAVARAGVPVVRPFTGIVDLDEGQSAAIRADSARIAGVSAAGRPTDRAGQGEHSPLCGGIVLIRRSFFILLGGWDERFRGWGGDDDAMTVKIARAGIGAQILPSTDGFHLHHARAAPTRPDDPLYRSNCDLLDQLRTVSDEELKRMCEVQMVLAGNPDLYRGEAR